jgi:phosphoglycolate phosphatase
MQQTRLYNRYTTLIFDFDYTLGNSEEAIILCANYALQAMGLSPAPRDAIRRTIGITLRDTYTILTGDDDPSAREQYATLFKRRADDIMTEHSHLYDGVLPMLQSLKARGIRIGIVTTKHRHRIRAILNKYDVPDLPDLIVGGDDVKVEKPDPEGLLFAVSHLGESKADVLYVGDSEVDAKTAAAAGIDFCAVLTGTTPREVFTPYRPLLVCDDVCALYATLCEQTLSKNKGDLV